jgi:hypothetical protein
MEAGRVQCQAHARDGAQCKRAAVPGKRVCASHGGKTPGGPASPHWKHGRWSKFLPTGLGTRAAAFLADPALLDLSADIAALDTHISTLMESLSADGVVAPDGVWAKIQELFLARARLVSVEVRRRQVASESITAAEAVALIARLVEIVRAEVTDPATRRRIAAAVAELAAGGGGAP